jgi:hypothetical protein
LGVLKTKADSSARQDAADLGMTSRRAFQQTVRAAGEKETLEGISWEG